MSKEYELPEESIDDISLLEPEATYSYADYLRWSFEERVELIKGKVFRMSAAPNRKHQDVVSNIFRELGPFLKGKTCKVYTAPFDVRLPQKPKDPNNQVFTVVQPDICVVCDESKLDVAGCNGAPDLVVEILSPFTASKDLKNKFELYEENGVSEYWVVYPHEEILEVFKLEGTTYGKPKKYLKGDQLETNLLPGLQIQLDDVFE